MLKQKSEALKVHSDGYLHCDKLCGSWSQELKARVKRVMVRVRVRVSERLSKGTGQV